jgi:hypothetical protein
MGRVFVVRDRSDKNETGEQYLCKFPQVIKARLNLPAVKVGDVQIQIYNDKVFSKNCSFLIFWFQECKNVAAADAAVTFIIIIHTKLY